MHLLSKALVILIALTSSLFSETDDPLLSATTEKKMPIAPEDVQNYSAGMEAYRLKEYDTAETFFQKALEKNPYYSDALVGLGLTHFAAAKQMLTKAQNQFIKALIAEPKNPEALECEGETLLFFGKIKHAYENYQTLQKINTIEADDLKMKLDPILNEAQEVLKTYQREIKK